MKYSVCKSYVTSQFVGFVDGWEYCLADGTTWRIIEPVYLIRKKKNPSASVYRDEDRHFLRVRGMPYPVEVEPVELPRCTLETPLGLRDTEGPQQGLERPASSTTERDGNIFLSPPPVSMP